MKKFIFIFFFIPLLSFSQSSMNMNLLGTYDYNSTEGNDIWGWVDANANEYALVGLRNGFSVVDVSNPSTPVEKFFIADINSIWRDVKTWGNYAYVTTEADAGLLIVDLTDMTGNTYSHVTQFTNNNGGSVSFTSAHDIYIDENGVAYIFGAGGSGPQSNGAIFLDVDANPTNPVYLGEWSNEYIHDGMVRGDTLWAGCIYAGKVYAIDVSDKSNPLTIGSHSTPNNFTHNVWVSDNGDYVFTTDEKTDAYITAYDVSDLNNIYEVDRIQSNPGSNSIPHNTFVDGNFLITSYYTDGTTVHDITYPNNMIQVAYYDSYSGEGDGYDGCWGTYPFLPSGNIISSDINSASGGNGRLLIYGRDFQQASFFSGTVIDGITGSPITNANIEVVNTSYTTITNLIGEYSLGTVDPGTVQVSFSAIGYVPVILNLSLSSGSNTILDAVLYSTISSFDGCTDPLACNYDSLVTNDDGSCEFTSCVVCNGDPITGLFVTDIIDDKVLANFDNMNTYDVNGNQVCRVDQIRIRYREVGTSSWSQKNIASPTGYDATTGICNSTQKIDKPIRNLTLGTTYEWQVKTWYCDAGTTPWVSGPNFMTAGECPNIGNLTAYGSTSTRATFDWDASNGSYEFVRLKARVDSISNPQVSDWFLIGGNGVNHGAFTKNKNGLVAGETYRGQARTWCDPNGGAYNSLSWTSLVTWTQPISIRIEASEAIVNLAIYPNSSIDVFNISFTSDTEQNLKVRVFNVIGEELVNEKLQQFIGEYTKQIDLTNNAKGIYFLEIETDHGIINKKLILQ